jgi:hypothetical protein
MISINELLTFMAVFLGSCLAAVIGTALTIALVHIIKVTKKIGKLIDDNAGHVNRTMEQLPALADNLNKAGASVKVNADKVGTSFGAIEGMFTGTPAAAEESNTLTAIVDIAESILKMIISYFAKKEKG